MVMSMQSLWPWCRWPADPPLSCSTGVKRGEPAHPWLGQFWTWRSHRTFVCSKYSIREKIVLFGPGRIAWDKTRQAEVLPCWRKNPCSENDRPGAGTAGGLERWMMETRRGGKAAYLKRGGESWRKWGERWPLLGRKPKSGWKWANGGAGCAKFQDKSRNGNLE